MKVVINDCFGGFGLSRECFLELFKRGAKIISRMAFREAHKNLRHPNGQTWEEKRDEYKEAKEPHWYQQRVVGHLLSDSGVYAPPDAEPLYCSSDNHAEEHRSDPNLIALIEQRGSEWASGLCAHLVIVEVPDDVEWTIEEYDGNELIAEVHRTWH